MTAVSTPSHLADRHSNRVHRASTTVIPLKADVPRQSPTLPSTGTPAETVPSTCRILTPQERALVRRLLLLPLPPPLLLPWKDEAVRQENDTSQSLNTTETGCPVWELWVIHMEGGCGRVYPHPRGDPHPPHRPRQAVMDCWSIYRLITANAPILMSL